MWIVFLCAEFRSLFELPHKDSVSYNKSSTFVPFENLYMVLDATELFSQAPSNSTAKKQMYSTYKSQVKSLEHLRYDFLQANYHT